jgi:hypothetical protein
MRHVDDGAIHAWLDRQIADPVERSWIEEHVHECATCSARLAEERATLEQAEALLAAVAPAADAGRPAFEALVARARNSARRSAPAVPSMPSTLRKWVIPASWAASLVLAVAIGWTARVLAPPDSASPGALRPASPPEPPPPPSSGSRVPASPSTRAGSDAPAEGRPSTRARSDALAEGRPSTRAGSSALGQRRRVPGPESQVPPPPVAAPSAPPPASSEPVQARDTVTVTGSAPVVTVTDDVLGGISSAKQVTPPPPMPLVAAGRGGRSAAGVGSGGGVGSPERAVDQVAPIFRSQTLADAGWRPLPRTEAAARSGMPLYGIEGLTPVATMLSADAVVVRTVYRMDSGETFELVQQWMTGATGDQAPATTTVAAEQPVIDVQRAAASSVWSTMRGDFLLTLRGNVNPDALGAKLRVD